MRAQNSLGSHFQNVPQTCFADKIPTAMPSESIGNPTRRQRWFKLSSFVREGSFFTKLPTLFDFTLASSKMYIIPAMNATEKMASPRKTRLTCRKIHGFVSEGLGPIKPSGIIIDGRAKIRSSGAMNAPSTGSLSKVTDAANTSATNHEKRKRVPSIPAAIGFPVENEITTAAV